MKLQVPRRRALVTAVGSLLGVQPGESLRLAGRWVHDRRYGEQFEVDSFLCVQPSTLNGIEKYLGSGLVKGIGRVMAERLVARFGLETLDVIERHPERLEEVEGIGPVRSRSIAEAWREQRDIRQVMIFLQSHDVSVSHAARIFKHYGSRAIQVVSENPYRLAADIHGIGFRTADRIASQIGVPRDSLHRAAAGVLHLLGEASGEGHLYLPRDELVSRAVDLLEQPPEKAESALEALCQEGRLIQEKPSGGETVLYLRSLFTAEEGVARRLRSLRDQPAPDLSVDLEAALKWFEHQRGMTLAPQQRHAVERALGSKLLVVTGGPGTGKTTLVRAIVEIFGAQRRRVLLAAPTGRAAKRLGEATAREARTIHRLLEFNPRAGAFDRNRERPLAADVIVVDEASMVDTVLAYNLVKAVPDSARLILVGDVDQLPPVGPGSLLSEVIASGQAAVVRLTEIFRQAASSLIVTNAHRILRGALPDLRSGADRHRDFFFIAREEPEEALETIKYLVAERIPGSFGFDPMDEIQVLTPMHRGHLGAARINRELQELLNPQGAPAGPATRQLRLGDKVMQTRNNYQLEVFNGDLGRVIAADAEAQQITVRFDERTVVFQHSDIDELVLAYACSVHKAQGSEYPCVVLPLHTQHYVMLRRNLLYTAVTRGQRLVVIVGTRRAVALAVRNHRDERRHTRLAERLRAGQQAQI